MKNIKYIAGAALLLALVACHDDADEYNPAVSLSFSPAVTANTRAAGAYPHDVPFGVWAVRSEQGGDVLFMDNEQVAYTGGYWLPATEYLWQGDDAHRFCAYSPYGCGAEYSPGEGIVLKGYNALTSNTDFMFTYPVDDCTRLSGKGCVPLPFIRSLSKVEFRVRSVADGNVQLRLRSLTIDNIIYEGDFVSLPQAHWVLSDKACTMEFCEAETVVPRTELALPAAMVIAQQPYTPVTLILDIYDANDGTLLEAGRKLRTGIINTTWRVGKYYTYIINVGDNNATFTTDILDSL